MRFVRPLNDLFQSSSHVAVLRALVELPEGYRASAREIARRAKVSHPVELRVLNSLVDQGVVKSYRSAHSNSYELNRGHALSDLILKVFQGETGLREDLIGFVRRLVITHAPSARQAYLFGSAATGETTIQSDIDVAVFWPGASTREVSAASQHISDALRKRYGNPGQLLVSVTTESALRKRRKRPSGAWKEVLDKGIPLFGQATRSALRRGTAQHA
jgi:predicted nucleotidyltransferase